MYAPALQLTMQACLTTRQVPHHYNDQPIPNAVRPVDRKPGCISRISQINSTAVRSVERNSGWIQMVR